MNEPLTLPDVDLYHWQAVRGQNGDLLIGALRAGGFNKCACGLVTKFDPAARSGMTTQGRRFRLVGPPGPDAQARECWIDWTTFLRSFDEDDEPLSDVSAEYDRAAADQALRRTAALPPRRPAG